MRARALILPVALAAAGLCQVPLQFNKAVSSDGRGSARITASARLFYQARVRTQGVAGQVYLEMWCAFGAKGEGENPSNVKLNVVMTGKGTAWIDDVRLLRAPLP